MWHCVQQQTLSNLGRCALREHTVGNKHIKSITESDNFFNLNNTNVANIIKYQIVVNNTSSNYTKINFRRSFLGYSPNGNCVITLLDKLAK